jgi:hypothetical protein
MEEVSGRLDMDSRITRKIQIMFEQFKKWVSELSESRGEAVHAQSGNRHAVLIDSMRVVIVPDGPGLWFAQSLDIDYAASGPSITEVQRNFERGLSTTIKIHLERFGNIDRIMKTPDLEDWLPLISGRKSIDFEYSMHATHDLADSLLSEHLPYRKIAYIEDLGKAA